jgi:hypothetical protein
MGDSLIIAKWKNNHWRLENIPRRGRVPRIWTGNYMVFSNLSEALKEIVMERKQPVCREDVQRINRGRRVCYDWVAV